MTLITSGTSYILTAKVKKNSQRDQTIVLTVFFML